MSDREYLKKNVQADVLSFMPQLLNVDNENHWIDNVISLGDLIEEKMGVDTAQLYFSVISEYVDRVMFGDDYEQG